MWNSDPGHNSTWNVDPGSYFHVELWPGSEFHVKMWPRVIIPRWIVTRVKIPRWNVTPAHNSTLNCDPGSWFHVEVRPQVSIQRWIVTPSHDSTLNCHLVLGSQFNVEFRPRVIIQRGILTRGYNSTWNADPSTYLLPVELRLKKVSKFNSVIKIQQLRRVTIQRKIHWILTPGQYSIGGSKFYLTPAGAKTYLLCNLSIFLFSAFTKRQGGCLYRCGCVVKFSILMSTMRKKSFFQSLRACNPTPSFLHQRLQYVWSASSTKNQFDTWNTYLCEISESLNMYYGE